MPRKAIIAFGLLAAATLAYLALIPTPQARAPIEIRAIPFPVIMDFDTLVAHSDVIALGQVTRVMPSRWNTPNGKLPPGITVQNIPVDLTIYTDGEFTIEQLLKGDVSAPQLRVRTFGGHVDQDSLTVEHEPSLAADQEYVLFLISDTGRTADIDPGHYLITGGGDSVYAISDGTATSGSEQWSVPDLVSRIQSAVH
jgi:hypothetical protein